MSSTRTAASRWRRFWPAAGMAGLAGLIGLAASADSPAGERSFQLPAAPYRYADVPFPAHFEERLVRTLDNTPPDNPTTDAGAALGRVLFYDTRLSANQTLSCGSCHQQSHAFASPDRVSAGFEGRWGERNAMSLVNLRFTRARFFWDERKSTLEEAVLAPVHSKLEMGHSSETLVRAVAVDRRYAPLFKAAFGSPEVTEERVARALSQFLRSLVSTNSRYDEAAAQVKTFAEDFPAFTAQENEGKRLFLQRCNLCHHIGEADRTAFFGMFRSLNNGLDPDRTARDGGLGDITLYASDAGDFKSPDLRNVAVTAPYMHDGRFKTLEEVIDHYKATPGVRPSGRFTYTDADKAALIAFLKTLTDPKFLSDPRFSDPWTGAVKSLPSVSSMPELVTSSRSVAEASSPADRLARGLGLRVGETLPWLLSLDRNGDGSLDAAEATPAAEVLVRTGVERLTTERGGRRGGPLEAPPLTAPATSKELLELGDFNGDGKVDETENRLLAALKRQIELGDGGRLETILDRQLSRFTLTTPQLVEVRAVFRNGKRKLYEQTYAADLELQGRLQSVLGPEQFARYQDLVVRGVQRPMPSGSEARVEAARKLLLTFDRSGDGRLDRAEVGELAKVLDELPNGFGRSPAVLTDLSHFQRRLFTYYGEEGKGVIPCSQLPERMHRLVEEGDTDRDGFLTAPEIETYVRKAAFQETVKIGIYIGGAFANTFQETAPVLDELALSPETRKAVKGLLVEHRQRLDALNAQATQDIMRRFVTATQKKTVSATP